MTHYIVVKNGIPMGFKADLESANRLAAMLQADHVECLSGPIPTDPTTASQRYMESKLEVEEDVDLEWPLTDTKVERPSGYHRKVGV